MIVAEAHGGGRVDSFREQPSFQSEKGRLMNYFWNCSFLKLNHLNSAGAMARNSLFIINPWLGGGTIEEGTSYGITV